MALVLLLLHTAQKCPFLLHPVHVFQYDRHCLREWLLPQYPNVCFLGVHTCMLLRLSLYVFLAFFILLNSFASVRLFITEACALCASILLAQVNTFSLVMTLPVFNFASSLIISPKHVCIIKPMNELHFELSVNPLVVVFNCQHLQPAHPFFYSSPSCLLSLWHCNDLMVLLNCGLNLFLRVSKSPSRVLHVTFSSFVILKNCSPFLPNQFITIANCSVSGIL